MSTETGALAYFASIIRGENMRNKGSIPAFWLGRKAEIPD